MAPKRAPPPPPSGQAPVSQEVVQIVKKKLSAPSGRPPAGMENFKMPKHLSPALSPRKKGNNGYDDDSEQNSPNNDRYDDDDDDYDDYDKKKYNNSYDDNDYIDGDDDWNRERDNNRRRHNKGASYDNDRGPGSKARNADDTISFSADSRDRDSIDKGKQAESKQRNADAKIDNNNKKKLTVFSFTPILKATYRELRAFITGPCPNGFVTRCYIERNRSGSNMLSPVYSLCADLEDGTGRELAVCRKVLMSTSAYYVFSLKSEDLYRKREQRSRLYLGKLRALTSNEYVLYDNGTERTTEHGVSDDEDGDNDAKGSGAKSEEKTSDENTKFRKELMCLYFNTKSRPGTIHVYSHLIFIIIII